MPTSAAALRSRFCPANLRPIVTGCTHFEQEARAASALNHPNIVTIYDLGRDGPTRYMAMEFIEGKTVRELLRAGSLPVRRVIVPQLGVRQVPSTRNFAFNDEFGHEASP